MIHLNGESFLIVQDGTEIEDIKAEQILLHYGDVITKFEKKKKMKED
jgi:hypothetical protein